MILTSAAAGAITVGGPGDDALRAAIQAAQPGDTIEVNSHVRLQSPIRIDKPLMLRADPTPALSETLEGTFEGELFQIAADGVTFEGLKLRGSPQTDGLLVEKNVTLRDCLMESLRRPVVDEQMLTNLAIVRLERVLVRENDQNFSCANLEAKDSTFSRNSQSGAEVRNAYLDGCVFEDNHWHGLTLYNGTVKNTIFRSNGILGLQFDPDDPGVLNLSNSLFYANAGGGLRLREGAVATVDNCTFTRHTGSAAVRVSETLDVIFRHCTVVDNVYFVSDNESSSERGAFVIHDIRVEGVKLQNCLIADNPTDNSPNDSGMSGKWIDAGGNVIGGSAGLGQLRDNGGPVMSLAPLPGSPAIDAGIASDLVLDARGLSRLAGTSPDAGAVESGAGPLADSDGDGMPDIWEVLHGLNPTLAADAASDVDGDGQLALAEFHSRTNPADPKSVFETEGFNFQEEGSVFPVFPASLHLTWRRVPGVTYQVEASTDFQTWRRVPGTARFWSLENGSMKLRFEVPSEFPRAFFRVIAGASS